MVCRWCSIESQARLCDSCQQLRQQIKKNPLQVQDVHPGFTLQVTYEKTKRCHDGYCSDHVYGGGDSEFSEICSEITIEYPLPRCFNRSHFDSEDNLISHRKLYDKSPELNPFGWCDDCKTYYQTVSIRLLKPDGQTLPERHRN